MSTKSYIQVYTGNGKGKTTAAIGLSIRALGAGKRVFFLQFMKAKGYSEQELLQEFAPRLELHTIGKPFFVAKEGSISQKDLEQYREQCVVFPPGQPPEDYVKLSIDGLKQARQVMASGAFDLVVLDEINCAMHFELLSPAAVLDAVRQRAANTEVVLTGRMAPQEILDEADLVTEMREIKHYYTQGVPARRGIEN